MLNKRDEVVPNLTAFIRIPKLIAHCETEIAINYKQAFYARRTAAADGLACVKVNYIRWHYKRIEYCS
jgi:hypothetical protein